jgi:hypothetical protein
MGIMGPSFWTGHNLTIPRAQAGMSDNTALVPSSQENLAADQAEGLGV